MRVAVAIKDERDGRVFIDVDEGMLRNFETVLCKGSLAKLLWKYPEAVVLVKGGRG